MSELSRLEQGWVHRSSTLGVLGCMEAVHQVYSFSDDPKTTSSLFCSSQAKSFKHQFVDTPFGMHAAPDTLPFQNTKTKRFLWTVALLSSSLQVWMHRVHLCSAKQSLGMVVSVCLWYLLHGSVTDKMSNGGQVVMLSLWTFSESVSPAFPSTDSKQAAAAPGLQHDQLGLSVFWFLLSLLVSSEMELDGSESKNPRPSVSRED